MTDARCPYCNKQGIRLTQNCWYDKASKLNVTGHSCNHCHGTWTWHTNPKTGDRLKAIGPDGIEIAAMTHLRLNDDETKPCPYCKSPDTKFLWRDGRCKHAPELTIYRHECNTCYAVWQWYTDDWNGKTRWRKTVRQGLTHQYPQPKMKD